MQVTKNLPVTIAVEGINCSMECPNIRKYDRMFACVRYRRILGKGYQFYTYDRLSSGDDHVVTSFGEENERCQWCIRDFGTGDRE